MVGYDWDDEVEVSDGGYTVFEEGDYDFKVLDFERGKVKSGKNANANQAIYTLRITDTSGRSAEEKYFIPLVEALRWKASRFFKSIKAIDPDMKTGESVKFPWSEVVGMSGRCHVKPRTWTGDDGSERQSNDITAMLVGDEQTPKSASATSDYGEL